MPIDNTPIDIAAVLSLQHYSLIYMANIEKKMTFLVNVIKMLDDNANRNARRRWFNTDGLKTDIDKEIMFELYECTNRH